MSTMATAAPGAQVRFVIVPRYLIQVRDIESHLCMTAFTSVIGSVEDCDAGDCAPAVAVGSHSAATHLCRSTLRFTLASVSIGTPRARSTASTKTAIKPSILGRPSASAASR